MPLFLAAILYGGAFFGTASVTTAHESMVAGNKVQQHYLQLKRTATAQVQLETLMGRPQ